MRATHTMTDLFGEVIDSYSRQQAISDGTLVDVTHAEAGSREAGLRWPVAFTRPAAQAALGRGDDVRGRLWDVMMLVRHTALPRACRIAAVEGSARVDFRVVRTITAEGDPATYTRLSLALGPGDDGEPVITLLLPHED